MFDCALCQRKNKLMRRKERELSMLSIQIKTQSSSKRMEAPSSSHLTLSLPRTPLKNKFMRMQLGLCWTQCLMATTERSLPMGKPEQARLTLWSERSETQRWKGLSPELWSRSLKSSWSCKPSSTMKWMWLSSRSTSRWFRIFSTLRTRKLGSERIPVKVCLSLVFFGSTWRQCRRLCRSSQWVRSTARPASPTSTPIPPVHTQSLWSRSRSHRSSARSSCRNFVVTSSSRWQLAHSSWLTSQGLNEWRRQVHLMIVSKRRRRSTSACHAWATASTAWQKKVWSTLPSETVSWPGYCRTAWEGTPVRAWSFVLDQASSTLTRRSLL